MGRPVSFDFTTGGGSPEEFLMGVVYLEPTLMHTIGSTVVLPDAPYPVKLVNGKAVHPDVAVSPAGPEPAWAYRVTIKNELTGKSWSEFRGVPTGTTQIAYKELPKFVTIIPPQTTAGMMQNWADTTEANAERSELAADRAEAPTDEMNKNLIEDPASLTATALSAAIGASVGLEGSAYPALTQNFVRKRVSGFGWGSGSDRNPFDSQQRIAAGVAGTSDKVGHGMTTIISGDYSAINTGSNPKFLWGANIFTTTGKAVGDGAGLNIQNLAEVSIQSAAGTTITSAVGFMAEAAFFGSTVGAHVTDITSMRVGSPKRKDGAGGGTASTSIGLFVETVGTGQLQSSAAFSVFVEGGTTRLGGRLDLTDTINNIGAGHLNIHGGDNGTTGARLELQKNSGGGHLTARMTVANAYFGVQGLSGLKHTFHQNGNASIGGGAGSFGGGSGVMQIADATTPPNSNPTSGGVLYSQGGALKWRSSAGTVTTIAPA